MEATCTDSVAEFECASVEVVVVAVEYDAGLFHPWPIIERKNSNYLSYMIDFCPYTMLKVRLSQNEFKKIINIQKIYQKN